MYFLCKLVDCFLEGLGCCFKMRRVDIAYFYSLPRAELLRHIQQMLAVLTDEQIETCFAKETKKLGKPSSRSLMDWSTIPLRHIAIQVCYDGTEYAGLAQQPNKEYTIEELLLNALRDAALIPQYATASDVHFERSGRTDRGVSAAGQVFSFYARTNNKAMTPQSIPVPDPRFYRDRRDGLTPPAKPNDNVDGDLVNSEKEPELKQVPQEQEIDYVSAINMRLPETIRVLGWAPVDENFSARHSTSSRHYIYTFGQIGSLNIRRMAEACTKLVGFHDFRNICKPSLDSIKTFERVIFSCYLEIDGQPYECENDRMVIKENSSLSLVVCGSAFLYHQIRCIASLLLHIGAELEPPSLISDLLNIENFPGKPDYPIAPGELLLFEKAEYTSTRLPKFYLSGPSYRFLTKNIRFLQSKALARARVYGAALNLLSEARTCQVVSNSGPPRACDHPLVSITLTHKITDLCEVYIEDGLSLFKLEKYRRITNRPFDGTLEHRLRERQKELAMYKENKKHDDQ
ncbi:Pseudouridylate synthase, putative [Giardia lamblia P15]|uniref:Pseudouridylate synthase, putative n=1 Tax=Giardia intestinalis (strain P15) TaxID=658858 RepID=E1F1Z7_GIAIA|nr:Pseudouridylate synthase, putative [Giardia lamblia P15]